MNAPMSRARLGALSGSIRALTICALMFAALSGIVGRASDGVLPEFGSSRPGRPPEVRADLARVGLDDSGPTAEAVDVLLGVLRRRPVLADTFVTPTGVDIAALALWSISAPDTNRVDILEHRPVLAEFATAMGVFPLFPDVFGSVASQILRSGIAVNGPAVGDLAVALAPLTEELAAMGVSSIDDVTPAGPALAWALTLDPADPANATVIRHRAYYLWALDVLGPLDRGSTP